MEQLPKEMFSILGSNSDGGASYWIRLIGYPLSIICLIGAQVMLYRYNKSMVSFQIRQKSNKYICLETCPLKNSALLQIDNIIQFNLLLMLTLTYVALLIRAGTNDFRDSTFSTWSIPSSAKCTMFGKLHFGNLERTGNLCHGVLAAIHSCE